VLRSGEGAEQREVIVLHATPDGPGHMLTTVYASSSTHIISNLRHVWQPLTPL
jgi:hypothetical protein